eukprot:TRINITY_DN5626_c0_g1_i1.p2 TRINITY_DN5626_c0_g1~~TRINITY_DN5626_c0_g1_i1.p2  ORF type:complete len:123 (-),score=13.06 TRINITY_DN5626_c0_g1_i1:366-734(-)
MDLAKKANDKGDYFPVWGICLGFQSMISVEIGRQVLTDIPQINLVDKIKIINRTQSTIFSNMPDHLTNYMKTEKSNYFNHHSGLPLKEYLRDKELQANFSVTSTAITKGKKKRKESKSSNIF